MTGRVVVLGSVNVDLTVRTTALPKAGETVLGSAFTRSPGGKGANQAVAAARVGAEVLLCAAVGTDELGELSLEALVAEGVTTDLVARVDDPTGIAIVVVEESGENQIVVVPGANVRAHGRGVRWSPGDVAMAVLEVPVEQVTDFLGEARAAGALTLLNASPACESAGPVVALADVLCVNETEFDALGGAAEEPAEQAVVVTLGSLGTRVIDDGEDFLLPAHEVDVVDTVGAGDAACGVLAAGLAAGLPLLDSVVRANAAGALTVRRAGARSSPSSAEIDEFLKGCR